MSDHPSPLTLTLDSAAAECGDGVSGQMVWQGSDRPAKAEVRLVATASATGSGGAGKRRSVVVGPALCELTSGKPARFELSVPAKGPITFASAAMTVSWRIEAKTQAADAATEIPVTVLPAGGLAVWAQQAAPPPQRDQGAG